MYIRGLRKSLKVYTGIEDVDFIECKLCGKRALYLDSRHLKTYHNLSKEDYLRLFPNTSLISEKKKRAQSRPNNRNNLGRKFSLSHRQKIRECQLRNNSFKGKHHSEEIIEKAKIQRKKTFLERYGVDNPMDIPSVRDNMSLQMINRILNVEDRRSRKGFFFSNKNSKNFYYRSELEKMFMQELEKDKSISRYEVEPFSIEYTFRGNKHRYIPDFLIDGKKIVEIKPAYRLEDEQIIAKIKAARRYAAENGLIFEVISSVPPLSS